MERKIDRRSLLQSIIPVSLRFLCISLYQKCIWAQSAAKKRLESIFSRCWKQTLDDTSQIDHVWDYFINEWCLRDVLKTVSERRWLITSCLGKIPWLWCWLELLWSVAWRGKLEQQLVMALSGAVLMVLILFIAVLVVLVSRRFLPAPLLVLLLLLIFVLLVVQLVVLIVVMIALPSLPRGTAIKSSGTTAIVKPMMTRWIQAKSTFKWLTVSQKVSPSL